MGVYWGFVGHVSSFQLLPVAAGCMARVHLKGPESEPPLPRLLNHPPQHALHAHTPPCLLCWVPPPTCAPARIPPFFHPLHAGGGPRLPPPRAVRQWRSGDGSSSNDGGGRSPHRRQGFGFQRNPGLLAVAAGAAAALTLIPCVTSMARSGHCSGHADCLAGPGLYGLTTLCLNNSNAAQAHPGDAIVYGEPSWFVFLFTPSATNSICS